MTRISLPIRRPDGSVLIEPLYPAPVYPVSLRPRLKRRVVGVNNTEVERGKIVRDIAILVLLAVTIIAGFAAIIGLILGDVALAESQARLVETELQAADERFEQEVLPMVVAGFGIAITAAALTRPKVRIGQ